MNCPVCGNKDSKVTDSRVASDGSSIRRRRECQKCVFRFSTLEQLEILDLIVIKRDGRREPYAKDKLEGGIKQSLRKRSYTDDKFRKLMNAIETDIQKLKRNEVTSYELGEIVMKHLKKFDTVGYIRFASVYRAFQDVQTFQKELTQLLHKNKKSKKK
ncbi:MAG: transcriptional regulator NrdR [bacterium]